MLTTLGLITLLSSAAVAGVYALTEEVIAKAKVAKNNSAIAAVVPEFDNDPVSEKFLRASDSDSLCFYPATKGGEPVGTAVETHSNNGFSGRITLMVGFLPDGSINGITVVSQNETPGLGSKMTEPAFTTQFVGKNPADFKLSVTKDGGDVDAITASTISSRAFCEAVQRAYTAFEEQKNKD